MSNLLDKASIILTPTAYNNGEALCVKPSDASGDFQFSRNSAATRVNAQGLVENVQILSSNLVQNGDFSEEGVQEVSNGSFSNGSTDWTLGTGWSIGEDKAVFDGTTINAISQNIGLVENNSYKVTFTVSNISQGGVAPVLGGSIQLQTIIDNGTYTLYSKSGVNPLLYFQPVNNFIGSITNISVKKVGQNWVIDSGWEIGNDKAIKVSGSSGGIEQPNIFLVGKKYKLNFSVSDTTSGSLTIYIGQGSQNVGSVTSNGDKEFIFTSGVNQNKLLFEANNSFNGSITNISVIEITDDTNLPRINYEGFSYQDALGSELVTNGDFATDSDWTKTGITIDVSGLKAVFTNTANNGQIRQLITTVVGVKYNMTLNVFSGSWAIHASTNTSTSGSIATTGTTTTDVNLSFTATTTTTYILFYNIGVASTNGSIDNVSVKEYLGQEVVPDSGCGSWLWESQSTNLITQSEDYNAVGWSKTSNITITNDFAISPDGTLNASNWVSVGGSYPQLARTITGLTIGETYTSSFYVKSDGTNQIIQSTWFTGFPPTTFTPTSKWTRITNTITATATSHSILIFTNSPTASASSFLLWGVQAEQGSYATSYIPTEGSTVTRNQDLCTNGGSLASINSTEGVLYAEIAINQNDNGSFRLISITDTTDTIRIGFGKKDLDAKWYIKLLIGSLDITSDTINFQEGFQKIAIRYKSGDIGVYINGTKVITDTSNYVNTLSFDNVSFDWNFNNFPFFGKTKALAVWKEALSDAELAELTYPTPTFPTFTLDFNTIAEQFTFARGSEATYVDAQGLIQSTASNNAPRLDYSTGAEAFLLEPQSTQLVTYSEDFSDASWNKNAVTLESGYLAPDGTNNAFKVSGGSGIMSSTPPTSQTTTRSIFARTVSGTGTAQLLSHNSNTNNIFTITEQWKRFEVNSANITGFNNFYAVDFRGSSSLSEIILWGANATNDQDYSTSYIPTSGTIVTRNQELCYDATPVINSEEGVLYAEIAALANDGTRRYISLNNGTNNYDVRIYFDLNGYISVLSKVAGTTQVFLQSNSYTQTDFNKVAFKYKENDFALWINGVKVATDTSGITSPANTLNQLDFNGNNLDFFGNTKDLQVYTKALSDAELIKLTTI